MVGTISYLLANDVSYLEATAATKKTTTNESGKHRINVKRSRYLSSTDWVSNAFSFFMVFSEVLSLSPCSSTSIADTKLVILSSRRELLVKLKVLRILRQILMASAINSWSAILYRDKLTRSIRASFLRDTDGEIIKESFINIKCRLMTTRHNPMYHLICNLNGI